MRGQSGSRCLGGPPGRASDEILSGIDGILEGSGKFGSHFEGCSNLNQGTVANPRTPGGRFLPAVSILHQVGPKREETALDGLGRVDGATGVSKELALPAAGLAEAAEVAGAVDVAGFEFFGSQSQEAGRALHIGSGEVDVSGYFTAAAATGLASEAETRLRRRHKGRSGREPGQTRRGFR